MSRVVTQGQGQDRDDLEALDAFATALADALDDALPRWIERCVTERVPAVDDELRALIDVAGVDARREVGAQIRELLALDVEAQRTGPLAIVRRAVRYPTAILQSAGAEPPTRDAFSISSFPEDLFDLSPASFSDLDPSVHEPGLLWGAAKAHVILRRRRGRPAEPNE